MSSIVLYRIVISNLWRVSWGEIAGIYMQPKRSISPPSLHLSFPISLCLVLHSTSVFECVCVRSEQGGSWHPTLLVSQLNHLHLAQRVIWERERGEEKRETERERDKQQERGETHDRGHRVVNSSRVGEVVKYVFPKCDGCRWWKDWCSSRC